MDPYDVLGCSSATPQGEIEAAYRLLLRRHHPDLHQAEGPEAVATAERTTQQLNVAMRRIRIDRGKGVDTSTYQAPDAGRRGGGFGGYHYTGPDPWQTHQAERGSDGDRPNSEWFGSDPVDHEPDEPVPCPYCAESFFELDEFKVHLAAVHRLRDTVSAPARADNHSSRLGRAVGKLRFVPAGLVALVVVFALIVGLPTWFLLSSMIFLLLVMWAQTTKRYKRRSFLDR